MDLQQLLNVVSLCRQGKDEWQWMANYSNIFSVKSAYTLLQQQQGNIPPNGPSQLVFKIFWKCKISLKVLPFSCSCCWIDYLEGSSYFTGTSLPRIKGLHASSISSVWRQQTRFLILPFFLPCLESDLFLASNFGGLTSFEV